MGCFRRFLFLLALVALVGFGTHAVAAALADTQGTPYATAFSYLSQRSVVQGYPDGTGRPNGPLNRAEALKVILSLQQNDKERVEWFKNNLPPIPLFPDVGQNQWYTAYVEYGFERGVVKGYPDGTFQPGRLLQVEEAIALLMRVYGEQGQNNGAQLSPYIANRDGQWFTPYVNAAINRNLLMHRGTLVPGQIITRGQFFDMAYRMHDVRSRNVVAFDGAEPGGQIAPTVAAGTPITSGQGITITAPQPIAIQHGGGGGGGQVIAAGGGGANTAYASEQYFAISLPSLGITDLAVIHPSDPFTSEGVLAPLQQGVGHLFSYPGNGGKVMIYGHSSGYPWDVSQYTKIFRKISDLKTGDRIYVTYEGKLFTYEVNYQQTIDAKDTSPFNDDGTGEELILYTCWPPDSIAQRYLVHAVPVSSVALR